jgi:hypothetical protein
MHFHKSNITFENKGHGLVVKWTRNVVDLVTVNLAGFNGPRRPSYVSISDGYQFPNAIRIVVSAH